MESKFQTVCSLVDRFILEQRHVAFHVSFHERSPALLCLASCFLVVFSQSVILQVGSSKIQGRLSFTSVTLCDKRELVTCTRIKPTLGVLAPVGHLGELHSCLCLSLSSLASLVLFYTKPVGYSCVQGYTSLRRENSGLLVF